MSLERDGAGHHSMNFQGCQICVQNQLKSKNLNELESGSKTQ